MKIVSIYSKYVIINNGDEYTFHDIITKKQVASIRRDVLEDYMHEREIKNTKEALRSVAKEIFG